MDSCYVYCISLDNARFSVVFCYVLPQKYNKNMIKYCYKLSSLNVHCLLINIKLCYRYTYNFSWANVIYLQLYYILFTNNESCFAFSQCQILFNTMYITKSIIILCQLHLRRIAQRQRNSYDNPPSFSFSLEK